MTSPRRFPVSSGINALQPFDPSLFATDLPPGGFTARLNSNENCLGPSPVAAQAVIRAASQCHRYPLTDGRALRHQLASTLKVTPEQIVIGCGSSEILALIARTYLAPADTAVSASSTFPLYKIVTCAADANYIEVPLREFQFDLTAIANSLNSRTRIIFLANPNNPTGTAFSREELEAFLSRVPQSVLVILDEAYREYAGATDFPNGAEYLSRFPNLVVLRTFSKIHGLAGLRIGYAIADPEIIDALYRVRSPYNVSFPAEEAALVALEAHAHVELSKKHNAEQLAFLQQEFIRLNVTFVPSAANFILLLLPEAQRRFKALASRGVLVAPTGALGLADGLRVTVGTQEENLYFVKTLDELLKS